MRIFHREPLKSFPAAWRSPGQPGDCFTRKKGRVRNDQRIVKLLCECRINRMENAVIFQGNSVALRPFEPDDVPALQAYLSHPDLEGRRYLPSGFSELVPLSRKQVEAVCEKMAGSEDGINMAVILPGSGLLVGHAGCDWGWDRHCPDLFLVIAPDQQRHGFGSEVIALLLRFVFEHTPAHVVTGWVSDWNAAGLQFLEKHGFQQAGRSRRAGIRHGSYYDVVVADLLRQEWLSRSKGNAHGA